MREAAHCCAPRLLEYTNSTRGRYFYVMSNWFSSTGLSHHLVRPIQRRCCLARIFPLYGNRPILQILGVRNVDAVGLRGLGSRFHVYTGSILQWWACPFHIFCECHPVVLFSSYTWNEEFFEHCRPFFLSSNDLLVHQFLRLEVPLQTNLNFWVKFAT